MPTHRLPPVKREDLTTDSQRSAFDALEKEATATFGPPDKSPFIYENSDGAFVGPFPFFLATPEAGMHFLGLFRKLGSLPGLSQDARETAILAAGAHYQAQYELYAHRAVSNAKTDLFESQIDQIAQGRKPDSLDEGCSIAYDVTKHLLEKPGKLSDELWERSIGAFGREGTVALVHYIGAYAYTCIVLNAMDCPVPESGS